MGRETIVADKLVSSGVGTIDIGSTGGTYDTQFTDVGDLYMGSSRTLLLLDGTKISVNTLLTISGAGEGYITTADGSQLRNYGTSRIYRIPISYTDIAVAGLTKTLDYSIDGGGGTYSWAGVDCFVRKITDFTGGGVTSVALEVGDDVTDPDGFLKTGQVDLISGAPALDGNAAADRGAYIDTFGAYTEFNGATTKLRLTFTAVTANLDQLTAGSCSVYFRYFTLPAS